MRLGSLLIVAAAAISFRPAGAIQWLALSRVSSLATTQHKQSLCEMLGTSFVRQQIRFCKEHRSFMEAVKVGAVWAIDECQFQFRTRRWNCSTLNDNAIQQLRQKLQPKPVKGLEGKGKERDVSNGRLTRQVPSNKGNVTEKESVGSPRKKKKKKRMKLKEDFANNLKKLQGLVGPYPIVPKGTREAAFVHAISSAGVAHAITKYCSSGQLEDCGCDRSVRGTTKQGFQWSGCSDNIAYGVSLSKRFVDARDKRQLQRNKRKLRQMNGKALVNLHNNEAGRKLIERNMKVSCKCHGVSGSCELKTCWKAMPSFRDVGEALKEKFDGATEVKLRNLSGRTFLEPNQQYFKKPTKTDLVYIKLSPEYCSYDLANGSLGTVGRECNKTSRGLDGCDLLCCSRGFTTHLKKQVERCSCKFQWCCFVQCRTCVKNVEVNVCN